LASTTRDTASTARLRKAIVHRNRILEELHDAQGLRDIIQPSPGRKVESNSLAKSSNRENRDGRLRVIGELAADFCHQIRTPLASLTLYIDQLDRSTPQAMRVAESITRGVTDIRRLANNMLGFAAGGREGRSRHRVADLFAAVSDTFRASRTDDSQLRIAVADQDLSIVANRPALKGALLNLVNNARQAGNRTTGILIHAHRYDDSTFLCVTDDGPGIPENIQARLFEPFFTTRPQGTGLGLSIVESVAKDHGGELSFTTSDLGSSFTIRIPDPVAGEALQ